MNHDLAQQLGDLFKVQEATMQEKKQPLHVRWLIRRDLKQVLTIEFMCAVEDNPMSEEEILSCLRQRSIIGMIAEREGADTIQGFMLYELHPKKLKLLRLGVDKYMPPEERAETYAALFHKLMCKLSSHRRTRVTFKVDERDVALQLVLREYGWVARRLIRRPGDESDLIQFRIDLEQPSSTLTSC